MAYLLLLAQPANTIPYTAIDAIAVTYRMPTSMFAMYRLMVRPKSWKLGPHGTVAVMMTAGTTVTIGAMKNNIFSAAAGVNSSLKISLTASAIGWSRPKIPARFGPIRTCMRESTLRSYQ